MKGEYNTKDHHQENIKTKGGRVTNERPLKKTSISTSSITAGTVATTVTGEEKKMPSDYKANLAEHEITEFPLYEVNKDCEDGKTGDK